MRTTESRTYHLTAQRSLHGPRLIRATKSALLFAVLCIGPMLIGSVQAIGLDEIAQQSGLGEPLRLVIPLLTNASDQLTGDEFAGECFKVIPATANDLPQVRFPRTALEHRGGRAFVVVSTQYPINEPMMRVAVQAGCRVSMSREYTLFFDPVSIEVPVVASEMAAPVEVPALARAPAPTAAAARPEPRPVVRPPLAPRNPVASVARTRPSSESTRSSRTVTAPMKLGQTYTAKVPAGPRLQVSRSIDDAAAAPVTTSPASKAAAEREALRALEEETVVLQRRVAELSLTMQRMDEEIRAARAARAEAEQAARVAKEQAAAATPWGMLQTWMQENGLLLGAFAALIVLIAALLLSRRRRQAVFVPAPITATQAEAFNPMDLGEPSVPGIPTLSVEAPWLSKEVDTERHARPPVAATRAEARASPAPPVPEFRYDPELAFDYEMAKTAEEYSGYSALEREQPGIVARLTIAWGTPDATAKLQDYLLTPRRIGKSLSREAIAELKLLQTIALEHAAADVTIPPRGGNGMRVRAMGK
ncbi:MAG: hypothetical protein E6H78_11790 [Betaproteobacteria bacterium]|nr:MAG: hypothetical protein E6H78_11790 [Betaproteobacteria bacterium]